MFYCIIYFNCNIMNILPYRYILSGSGTKYNAENLLNKLDMTSDKFDILLNIIYAQRYNHMFDSDIFLEHMNNINSFYTYEDAYDYFNSIKDETSDISQIKTLQRIINMKKHKITSSDYNRVQQTFPYINCPFCSHSVYKTNDTSYVVCGFDIIGFDDIGCRNESCFTCNLKFCNKWTIMDHPPTEHVMHDDVCCAEHAKTNNYIYPNEYCMCDYARKK